MEGEGGIEGGGGGGGGSERERSSQTLSTLARLSSTIQRTRRKQL